MPAAETPTESSSRRQAIVHLSCVALTAVVGVFLASDVRAGSARYTSTAWTGVAFAGLALLLLAGVYVVCAVRRLRLDAAVAGRATWFHLTVGCVVAFVGADLLIPARDAGSLSILLPFGVAYWFSRLTGPDH